MSDYRVLQDISLQLRRLLYESLRGNDPIGTLFSSENNISLDSPARIADRSAPNADQARLSLYLYQVTPNAHINNHPMIAAGPGRQQHPPLSLNLYYLLTPVCQMPEDNLVVLGRCAQILAANATIQAAFLDSWLRPDPPEVRVTINPVSLEELTRIWNAFSEAYRLSMCYVVQAVSIDSAQAPQEEPPVSERLLDMHQIVAQP
jgi:hypothetical protein